MTCRRAVPAAPVLLLVLLLVLVAGAGCGAGSSARGETADGGSSAGVTGTVTVAAAASLTAPFTTIIEGFTAAHPGVEVLPTYDSSATLVTQVVQGAPVDVLAVAEEATMTTVTDAGLLAGPPRTFARNALAIVVKAGNPARVRSLADLASAGTVALCGATVPCGRYAEEVLARAGVVLADGAVTRGQNARATFTAVAEGDADAGIVYATDISGGRVEAVPIPDDGNVVARYPIGIVAAAANRPAAEAFVAYVTGPAGRSALAAAGFLPPP